MDCRQLFTTWGDEGPWQSHQCHLYQLYSHLYCFRVSTNNGCDDFQPNLYHCIDNSNFNKKYSLYKVIKTLIHYLNKLSSSDQTVRIWSTRRQSDGQLLETAEINDDNSSWTLHRAKQHWPLVYSTFTVIGEAVLTDLKAPGSSSV